MEPPVAGWAIGWLPDVRSSRSEGRPLSAGRTTSRCGRYVSCLSWRARAPFRRAGCPLGRAVRVRRDRLECGWAREFALPRPSGSRPSLRRGSLEGPDEEPVRHRSRSAVSTEAWSRLTPVLLAPRRCRFGVRSLDPRGSRPAGVGPVEPVVSSLVRARFPCSTIAVGGPEGSLALDGGWFGRAFARPRGRGAGRPCAGAIGCTDGRRRLGHEHRQLPSATRRSSRSVGGHGS